MSRKMKLVLFAIMLAIGGLFLLILVPSLADVVPTIFKIISTNNHQELVTYLRSFGLVGAGVLFALQFLQSLLPIFPAVILQLTAGITYGPILGTLIIVSSNCLANFLIFYFLRRYKIKEIHKILNWKIFRKFTAYFQSKNPDLIVFVFYLFPFLTNSVVPYLAYSTKINTRNYLFTMTAATLPMTFLSVYLGDRLIKNDWTTAIIVSLMTLAISITLFKAKGLILKFIRKREDQFV